MILIGTGIAGSALAYELEHTGIPYLICTDQKNPLCNTSSLSYGHCRLATDLEEIVRRSVSQLGEDEEKMRFVYSQTHLVPELLTDLGVEFEKRSFGIIPIKQRGGNTIVKKLQSSIPNILTETMLIDFSRTDSFDITFKKAEGIFRAKSKFLVLATGGYAGSFSNTDNLKYSTYNIFDLVRKNKGEIINTECLFIHPFGYKGGKHILIGKVTKTGEFVDDHGNFVFNEKTRQLIKDDNYHEIFDQLLAQADTCRANGSEVYFVNAEMKEKVTPCIHYTSGGVRTDYLGRAVGCPGLFAIGECQANGSRKNGRFPGYPFTSSIVYGKVLAGYFAKELHITQSTILSAL